MDGEGGPEVWSLEGGAGHTRLLRAGSGKVRLLTLTSDPHDGGKGGDRNGLHHAPRLM
jgi:hypothetical protein